MSYAEGQILVGDINNFVHVIDPSHGNFELSHVCILIFISDSLNLFFKFDFKVKVLMQ